MSLRSQGGFGGLPRNAPLEMVIDELNRHLVGRLNVGIAVTLRSSQTTTTLTDPRIGANSNILDVPLSASAAAARSSLWYSNFAKGSCTINHAANAATDQNFRFVILG